jgi:hypothetical protein
LADRLSQSAFDASFDQISHYRFFADFFADRDPEARGIGTVGDRAI